MTKPTVPTVGRIVLVTSQANDRLIVEAALITSVAQDSAINVAIFADAERRVVFEEGIRQAPEGVKPGEDAALGRWQWPFIERENPPPVFMTSQEVSPTFAAGNGAPTRDVKKCPTGKCKRAFLKACACPVEPPAA